MSFGASVRIRYSTLIKRMESPICGLLMQIFRHALNIEHAFRYDCYCCRNETCVAGACAMDDERIMHGMRIDDAYRVVRVLANRRGRVTELVTLDDAGPFVRKKMPLSQANRVVWATLPSCACKRLPQLSTTYELPDTFVVVHNFVPGETVEARVREKRRLDAREAVEIALDVCEALIALHCHGIIHCDISPANIVLAADGAHLIDLGAARMTTDAPPKRGERLGTLGYAAPERMLATPSVQSDVYSIGRVLGYMLSGADPAEDGFDSALAGDAKVPQDLRDIVARACAFEASARYGSAEEMASTLQAWLSMGDVEESSEKVAGHARTPQDVPVTSEAAALPSTTRDRRIIKFTLLALAVVMALCGAGIIVYRSVIAPLSASVADRSGESSEANGTSGGSKTSSFFYSNSGGTSGTSEINGEHDKGLTASLELVEMWWEQDTDGLFQYIYGIKNTSPDVKVSFPEVVVTGKDAQGGIVSVDSCVGLELLPGQTQYFYGVGGVDGNPPADVEFSITEPKSYDTARSDGKPSAFEVSNISIFSDGYGGTSVTGEITLVSKGDDMPSYATGLNVTVVARDASGAMVFGQNCFPSLPSEGSSVSFQVDMYGCPAFESVDVYATPW